MEGNSANENQRDRAEDDDASMLLFTTMIDTMRDQTKMMESLSQQQNMMMAPTIPVFDGEPNKYRSSRCSFRIYTIVDVLMMRLAFPS